MYSEWLMFIWFLFSLCFSIVIAGLPLFKSVDGLDKRNKNSLDGLRCVLALMVVFHHFFLNYYLHTEGEWIIKNANFFSNIGPFAVGLFFILSGYLFSNIDLKGLSWWLVFYKKRIFRIVPISIVSSVICIIVAYHYGTSSDASVMNIIPWFDGGIANIRPTIFGMDGSSLINSGVSWTLVWEWRLYFSLPIVAILVPLSIRLPVSFSISSISLALFLLSKSYPFPFDSIALKSIFFFSAGFFCRHIKSERISILSNNKLFQAFIVVITAILLFFSITIAKLLVLVLSVVIFLMVCNGCSFFGLLVSKGAIRIGIISYSVYLLHGIFWYVGFLSFINEKYLILSSSVVFIAMMVFSFLVSKYIEYPIYERSKG